MDHLQKLLVYVIRCILVFHVFKRAMFWGAQETGARCFGGILNTHTCLNCLMLFFYNIEVIIAVWAMPLVYFRLNT